EPECPPDGRYNIYPGHDVGGGEIELGFEALARRLAGLERVVMDGFIGVFWDELRDGLDAALRAGGVTARWVDVSAALRPEAQINEMIAPFLGGDDPIFGTRFTGRLADFLDPAALREMRPDPAAPLNILY